MLKIAICDDEHIFVDQFAKFIEKLTCIDYTHRISRYYSGQELLKDYQEGTQFDLIFIDIRLNGLNGIDIAKEIRKLDHAVMIVFLSAYRDFMNGAFGVKPEQYMLKQEGAEMFEQVFRRCVLRFRKEHYERTFHVKNRRGEKESLILSVHEILYFECVNRQIYIYTMDNQRYLTEGKITHLANELNDKGFYHCHRSYLVNLAYVKKINAKDITLKTAQNDNGSVVVPIARGKHNEANKILMEFKLGGGVI